jgi:acetyl-CoA C-acetyltransferase
MSLSPHVAHMRAGTKMGDVKLVDSMIKDGLWDAFHGYHMGTTAENVAQKWQISRDEQDVFAVASQNKAEAAQKSGRFKDEIAGVTMSSRKGDVLIENDEHIRAGTTLAAVSQLKPAFSKDGTVTAGNASGLNDGAAAVVVMRATEAERRCIKPMARIASWATAGVDPAIMGTGPIPASRKALEKAGWKVADLDLVEANEGKLISDAVAGMDDALLKVVEANKVALSKLGGSSSFDDSTVAKALRELETLEEQFRDGVKKDGSCECAGQKAVGVCS